MADEAAEQRELMMDVLDRLCSKLKVHSSSLVYLDHHFKTAEIDQVNQFMLTQTIADHAVSKHALARVVAAIKSGTTPDEARQIADELMSAWLEEDTFKAILE